jgi:hypothetical protein
MLKNPCRLHEDYNLADDISLYLDANKLHQNVMSWPIVVGSRITPQSHNITPTALTPVPQKTLEDLT